ncbi:MAG: adenine-specific DNA-methyltransferase [Arcticibacterium sp.]|jgi:adenine-specific DNA-methyltransferase
MRGDWFSFESRYIKDIPITTPNKIEKSQIESLVNQILSLKKENPSADTSALEAEIDQLVYQLYDLTAEEIAIVEAGVR